jgi:heme/copper-type cytochrome/quinol oxidase subunit 2
VLLTAIGEYTFLSFDIFGDVASEQGVFIDDAFVLLVVLAIPIFTFVVTVLGYSAIVFRTRNGELEDSEPTRTHRKWVGAWLIWTTVLCLVVIVHP